MAANTTSQLPLQSVVLVLLLTAVTWLLVSVEAFALHQHQHQHQHHLYITIGPPCSGKTDALASQLELDGYSADQVNDILNNKSVSNGKTSRGVYQRIPVAAFLFPSRLDPDLANTVLQSGITVQERLLDPTPPLDRSDEELRNVLVRLAGRKTPAEFAQQTHQLAQQAGDVKPFFQKRRLQVSLDLIHAVEAVSNWAVTQVLLQELQQQQPQQQPQYQQQPQQQPEPELPYHETESLPSQLNATVVNATTAQLLSAKALIQTPVIQLFVPQAIFQGLDRAQQRLKQMARANAHQPVVWSNTNTRPLEYAPALRVAQDLHRPVTFVVATSATTRSQILQRNVMRLRETGRYLPAGALAAACGRVETLLQQADKEMQRILLEEEEDDEEDESPLSETPPQNNNNSNNNHRNMAWQKALASLAGFDMDDAGYVTAREEEDDNGNDNRESERVKRKRANTRRS